MGNVTINHKNKKSDGVSTNNLLTGLLIKNREKVLFVGEGDFTFTLAFAAYRQIMYLEMSKSKENERNENEFPVASSHPAVWEGITSTRYEPVGREGEEKRVGWRRVQCKPEPTLSSDLVNIPDASVLMYGIDALALSQKLTEGRGVIWFQCPWVPKPNRSSTATLVSDFLLNMAAQIQPGVHVCVGIVNKFPYSIEYKLEAILGKSLKAFDNDTAVLKKYNFVGADTQLVKQLIEFGYHHRSVHENAATHEKMLKHHVTLVFRRKEKVMKRELSSEECGTVKKRKLDDETK